MKRGPKPQPPSVKVGRGTFQPVRDGVKTEMVVAGDPPMMPEYLNPEAQLVWQEEIGRVMAAGVSACHCVTAGNDSRQEFTICRVPICWLRITQC